MATRAQNAQIARKLLTMTFVGEVVYMQIARCAAVRTPAARGAVSISPTGSPLRAPKVDAVLPLALGALLLLNHGHHEPGRAERPNPPREVDGQRLSEEEHAVNLDAAAAFL